MQAQKPEKFTVMTWNLYLGAPLKKLYTSKVREIPKQVSKFWTMVQDTDFPARAAAMADKIYQEKPVLIGLQEAFTYELFPPEDLSGYVSEHKCVELNYVQLLQKKLAARGLYYFVVAESVGEDVELPTEDGAILRVTDRQVILASFEDGFTFCNPQDSNFMTRLVIPVAGLPFLLIRGWASIDVKTPLSKFRFITTHLELGSVPVQLAQVSELLLGPCSTDIPIIIAGDFNSDASGSGSATYNYLLNAGLEDSWVTAGEGAGCTCCQETDLRNQVSDLDERIDLILYRGGFRVLKAKTLGDRLKDRVPPQTPGMAPMWPSDHAGVSTTFLIS